MLSDEAKPQSPMKNREIQAVPISKPALSEAEIPTLGEKPMKLLLKGNSKTVEKPRMTLSPKFEDGNIKILT